MLCVKRNREFRRVGFKTSHWFVLACMHAFKIVPECFKRPDKLIFVWVSPCPGAGSPGGGQWWWEQSDAAKDVKPHLSTLALWAEVISGLVGFIAVCSSSFHISYQGAACRPQGTFFLSLGSQFCSGHFFCLLCRQNFFSIFFFSFPKLPLNFWCWYVLWQIEKSPHVLWDVLIIFCQALSAYHFHTTFPTTFFCNFIVGSTQACAQISTFYENLILLPYHFSCLLSSCAMRLHDVNLFSPRYCVASLQIKWWWSSLGLGNRKRWTIPCLHKTGRTVGAELGLEPRISHRTACHNKKGNLQQLLFLRRFVKSPVIGLVNTKRWETKQNVLFQFS